MKTITFSQHEDLKRAAKRLKKELGISHSEGLEQLAREAGFRDYHHLQQSIENPRPHQGRTSNFDDAYRKVPLGAGEIWFAMDVKDAQKYDHAIYPKRWGIQADEGKMNSIMDDFREANLAKWEDSDSKIQDFYWNNRIFSLSLPHAKTLLDVVSYVREITFWEPTYVFQDGAAFECYGDPVKVDYQDWINTIENKENEDDQDDFVQDFWKPL
ncbi:MAG: glyoxalase superfamily protein [Candidatus Ozemobacteraceae bacterium]